jgi:hypothetical protein
MTWNFWADPLLASQGDIDDPDFTVGHPGGPLYQGIIFHRNLILKAIRMRFIVYDKANIVVGPLALALYSRYYDPNFSNTGTIPAEPIALSDTKTLSDFFSDPGSNNHSANEIAFNFDFIPVKSEDEYFLALVRASGVTVYNGDQDKHIAWPRGWPDPIWTENFTPTANNVGSAPYYVGAVIGADQ